MNLVFILFDDLRPELSLYGRTHMITPNFERLAKKSVTFDKVFAQISVCNPSRDSMLTGLRPDTGGTYSFQSSNRPHLTLPMQLTRTNYATAAFGKIFHWELDERIIWSEEMYFNKWYEYQNDERNWMNSTTLPDKNVPEEMFRDYDFTTKAIQRLEKMIKNTSKNFMLAIGYKLPHLQMHVPYKYYEMYKDLTHSWKLSKRESRFPHSVPDVAYRCCAEPNYMYMEEEGSVKSTNVLSVGDINMVFNEKMRDELMKGYCASITFVDAQLGRLLDVMDKHNVWKNTVVVLSADHGMHNGEKGIWEKWSMFDESTRVPLLIAHPDSPYKGQHYTHPVELVDIYPTIVDLLDVPFSKETTCGGTMTVGRDELKIICQELQGKSLAPVVLGSARYEVILKSKNHKNNFNRKHNNPALYSLAVANVEQSMPLSLWAKEKSTSAVKSRRLANADVELAYNHQLIKHNQTSSGRSLKGSTTYHLPMPTLEQTFAITQSWRCAKKDLIRNTLKWYKQGSKGKRPHSKWMDCDKTNPDAEDETSIMGYSLRSNEFRYTAWFHYDRRYCLPLIDAALFDEELYDHRNETFKDFTHLEIVNLAHRPIMKMVLADLRRKLIDFVRNSVLFRGCFRD